MSVVVKEIRIHADKNGKYTIPEEYRAEVSYGSCIKSMVSTLYSECVVSTDHITDFINSTSGNVLSISGGTVYNICKYTKNRLAKKEEAKLLRRLDKYIENHLLFLIDFRVYFDDNMSERDLRKCKNRQKMLGGFRTEAGIKMYCNILSVVETIKRRKICIFNGIKDIFEGRPVFT